MILFIVILQFTLHANQILCQVFYLQDNQRRSVLRYFDDGVVSQNIIENIFPKQTTFSELVIMISQHSQKQPIILEIIKEETDLEQEINDTNDHKDRARFLDEPYIPYQQLPIGLTLAQFLEFNTPKVKTVG